MLNSFNSSLKGAYDRIAAHHNNVQSTDAAIRSARFGLYRDASAKILAHHNNVQSTAAAIDAASPFGPVGSNFIHNPDALYSPPGLAGPSSGSSLFEGASSKIGEAVDSLGALFDRPTSAPAVSSSQLDPQTLDYLNADLARSYGMDRTTAYQEALSNTSYQRAVRDMQAAGLNPAALFGNGRASGSGGVSYVSSAGSGSSGSVFSGKSNSGKLFSEGLYVGISTAAGIATAAITGNPSNYDLGLSAAKGVMSALDSIF